MNWSRPRLLLVAAAAIGLAAAAVAWSFHAQDAERSDACLLALADKIVAVADPRALFEQDFARLQQLVEQSLVARARMLRIHRELDNDGSAPIGARHLLTLKEGTRAYLEVRGGLYEIATAYECAADVSDATLQEYGVEPDLRLKALMLSLGAALTLYDNYMLGVILFEGDERLRRVVNDPDRGFGLVANELEKMTLAASSISNRQRVRRAIKFFEAERARLSAMDEDSDYAYLAQLIDNSPSYNYARKIRVGEIVSKKFEAFGRMTGDSVNEAQADGMDMLSALFGNTVGMYDARKGKLHGDQAVLKKLQDTLQPLDILLEKTPFRLTDKLIPGHFGHVAIWVGTRQELTDLGIWSHEATRPHHEQLSSADDPSSRDAHQVIEALRSGVQLNKLEDFINVDDLVVLRPVFDEAERQALTRESLILAFRQVGKEYDFNFDVDTTDKIVCSELAYVSIPSIEWPTERKLGRYTISPDNIAQMARKNVPLELVLFYRDGKLVGEARQLALMNQLLSE